MLKLSTLAPLGKPTGSSPLLIFVLTSIFFIFHCFGVFFPSYSDLMLHSVIKRHFDMENVFDQESSLSAHHASETALVPPMSSPTPCAPLLPLSLWIHTGFVIPLLLF